MEKWSKKKLPEIVFCIFALLWMAPLFFWCLTLTGTNPDPDIELITIEPRSVPKMLLLFIIAFGVLYLAGLFYERFLFNISVNLILSLFCLLTVSIAVFWILSARTVPEYDQLYVYEYARDYLQGDRSMLERGGYMAIYSQNLGLMTLWMGFILLFGEEPFLQFQVFNALLLPVLVFCGYRITGMLSGNNRKAQFLYLLLITGCVPIYGYAAFLYSDLLSIVLLFLCADLVLRCICTTPPLYPNTESRHHLETRSILRMASAGIAAFLSVYVRKNSLIILLAFLIVTLIRLLREKACRDLLLLFFSLIAGTFLLPRIALSCYPIPEDASPIPAATYFYMGANGREDAPGWYDGSGPNLFSAHDYNPESTSAAAMQGLKDTLRQRMESPASLISFYYEKTVLQWEAPMYQCLAMPRLFQEDAPAYVHKIYYREGIGMAVEKYMKAYQLVLYGSILFLLLGYIRFRRIPDITWFSLLLAAWGGFLFSLIWEAKTRYVLPYFVIMIPYLAIAASKKPLLRKKRSERRTITGASRP